VIRPAGCQDLRSLRRPPQVTVAAPPRHGQVGPGLLLGRSHRSLLQGRIDRGHQMRVGVGALPSTRPEHRRPLRAGERPDPHQLQGKGLQRRQMRLQRGRQRRQHPLRLFTQEAQRQVPAAGRHGTPVHARQPGNHRVQLLQGVRRPRNGHKQPHHGRPPGPGARRPAADKRAFLRYAA